MGNPKLFLWPVVWIIAFPIYLVALAIYVFIVIAEWVFALGRKARQGPI